MNIVYLYIEKRLSNLRGPAVSVEANLREHVKPQRGGRSQNRRVARGLPV